MDKQIQDLVVSLRDVLIARDFNMTNMSDGYLRTEIIQAIGAINRCRRFTQTESALYDSKYEYLIIPMCVSSIAKIGAEGQNSHSENGITRYYSSAGDYPKELLSQIIPLIK
nr:MAG TPA: hypothetical protein [Bacteriophage sp.]